MTKEKTAYEKILLLSCVCGHIKGKHSPSKGCNCSGMDKDQPVTITISREDAEHYAKPGLILEELQPYLIRLNAACQEAIDAQDEYDNSPELQTLLRRAASKETE